MCFGGDKMRSILTMTEKARSKKGSLNLLTDGMLLFAVVAIVAVLVFQINQDARADLTAGTIGYNATIDSDDATAKIPARLPLLATAIVFGAVLYVIFRVLPVRQNTF